jgi:uncharacterized membrane protein YsdA (DUF1294 family)
MGGWSIVVSAGWLTVAVALLALAWFRDGFRLPWLFHGYLALTVCTSAACFVAYGIDKRRAVRQGRRIPERVLHRLALAGGWAGALLAQRTFRHKTQKFSFRLKFWLIVAAHAIAIVLVFWFF